MELPSGTLTLLFTDVERSTELLSRSERESIQVLSQRRDTLERVFGFHNGFRVDARSEELLYAFTSAAGGLTAARAGQAALGDIPPLVRMGLHTGEPERTKDGYGGLAVHKGARIA